jgi:hypothetical protein
VLLTAVEQTFDGKLDDAREQLEQLAGVAKEIPSLARLRVYYNLACIHSLYSEAYWADRQVHVDKALEWLRAWLTDGLSGAWRENGYLPKYEIYRMTRDRDLQSLIDDHGQALRGLLPEDLWPALNTPRTPDDPDDFYEPGCGCVPLAGC